MKLKALRIVVILSMVTASFLAGNWFGKTRSRDESELIIALEARTMMSKLALREMQMTNRWYGTHTNFVRR